MSSLVQLGQRIKEGKGHTISIIVLLIIFMDLIARDALLGDFLDMVPHSRIKEVNGGVLLFIMRTCLLLTEKGYRNAT